MTATSSRPRRTSTGGDEELYRMAMRFVTSSTAHGLPKVAKSDSCWGRIFWTSILVGAMVMFCVQCTYLMQRFFSYPKSVKLEVINQPVPFPAVSICNLRPLDLYTFVDTLFEENSVLRWRVGKDFDYHGRPNSSWPNFERSLIQFGHSYSAYFMFAEVLKRVGENSSYHGVDLSADQHLYSRMTLAANFDRAAGLEGSTQKSQFIGKCVYAGEPCRPDNFTGFIDPAYFSCYTFDMSVVSQDAWHTIYEGPDHGLSLVLFVPSIGSFNLSDSALDSLAIGQDLSLGGEGIRLVIHEQNTVPYPLTDGIDIPRGVSASVGITMEQNARLGPPYGNCTLRRTLDESMSYSYTMASCKKVCLQNLVIGACGCADISLPLSLLQNVSFCATFDAVPEVCRSTSSILEHQEVCAASMVGWFTRMACMKGVKANISKNLSAWADCDCQPRCYNNDYKYSLSLSDWPMAEQSMRFLNDVLWNEDFLSAFPADKASQYFAPLLAGNATFDEYAAQIRLKNFVRMNVYISDTSVVKIEEIEAYGFTQMISDVGGQLGLWIGVSVISLVELFELLFQLSIFAVGRFFVPTQEDSSSGRNSMGAVKSHSLLLVPTRVLDGDETPPETPRPDDVVEFNAPSSPLHGRGFQRPNLPNTIYSKELDSSPDSDSFK